MREIEVKILEIDKAKMISQIESFGAKKTYEGETRSVYFRPGKGKRLRVRKFTDKVVMTFKQKVSLEGAKIEDETEVRVEDFDRTLKIIEGIGLEVRHVRKKHRTSYKLGDIGFEIDEVEGIPSFMEIEAPSVEIIEEYAKKLGFSRDDLLSWTEGDVEKHYSKKA